MLGKCRADQRELARAYLNAYCQSGRAAPALDEFGKEISIAWFARKLNLWEHLPKDPCGLHYLPGATDELREARLDSLYRTMSMLVSTAGRVEPLVNGPNSR